MKEKERLLLIAILISVGSFWIRPYLTQFIIPQVINPQVQQVNGWVLNIISPVLAYIGNLGIGYWLYTESQSGIWMVGGIVFGIPGLILYYLLEILKKNKK